MWTCHVWLSLAAWLAVATAHPELRCTHPLCRHKAPESWVYYVEGQKIVIGFIGEELIVECQGNELVGIDSPAMPRFSSPVFVPSFGVSFCPPPRNNTYVETLAALNVTLLQTETQGNLRLHLAPQPPLTARHFLGMEDIISLVLESYLLENMPAPKAGFLAPLHRLRKLEIFKILLPAGELDHLPESLLSLDVYRSGVTLHQGALQNTPKLRKLSSDKNDVFRPPKGYNVLGKITLRTEMIPSLETVSLVGWKETRPAVLSQCDALRNLNLIKPLMKELPDRWVAACAHLDTLTIEKAGRLTTLPSKLLEGANSLESFSFENGVIVTLPEKLFAQLPKLRLIFLRNNHLHTLPSGIFMGLPALHYLNLVNNYLEANVRDSLQLLVTATVRTVEEPSSHES